MKNGHVHPKIIFLILLNVFAGDLADLLVKKGILSTGIIFSSLNNLWVFISANILSLFFLSGILLYLLAFIMWITILRSTKLSTAYQLGNISYIVVPVLSIIFLHESIPSLRWLGIASITAGAFFVSRSGKGEDR